MPHPNLFFPQLQVATISILKIQGFSSSHLGISCLHVIQNLNPTFLETLKNQRRKLKSSHYQTACYFIKSDQDISEKVERLEKEIRARVHRMVDTPKEYKETELMETLEDLVKKKYYRASFIRVIYPNTAFLEKRRAWISEKYKKKDFDCFKDPKYQLQPQPSVDIAIFDLPIDFMDAYKYYLSLKNGADFFSDQQSNFESENQTADGAFMNADEKSRGVFDRFRAYSQSLMKVSASLKPYIPIEVNKLKATLKKEQKLILLGFQGIYFSEVTEGMSNKNSAFPHMKQLLDSDFFNPGLSATGCIVKENDGRMVTYVGNTSFGSSGSPMLDENCNIRALSFAHYIDEPDDIEEESLLKAIEKFSDIEDDTLYDVTVEVDSESKTLVKNRNIGMFIGHPVLLTFLEDYVKGLKKEINFKNFGSHVKEKLLNKESTKSSKEKSSNKEAVSRKSNPKTKNNKQSINQYQAQETKRIKKKTKKVKNKEIDIEEALFQKELKNDFKKFKKNRRIKNRPQKLETINNQERRGKSKKSKRG